MRPAVTAVVGGVFGLLLSLMLGFVVFGIGLAQDSVYAVPGVWRGGVEPVQDGFEFVIAPNFAGILVIFLVATVAGLILGMRGRSRV